jgi:DNA-directed RNA polymerase specialized sigma24 family protein
MRHVMAAHMAGETPAQIAGSLGLSRDTIQVELRKARAILRNVRGLRPVVD